MKLQKDLSLIELAVVTAILGITALAVIPNYSSTDPLQLESSATLVAEAMRFARSESIRTGLSYGGVEILPAQKRIRLFHADTSVDPPTPVYDVYQPLSKKLYDIQLGEAAFAATDAITATLNYPDTCDKPNLIIFDNNGVPFCGDPANVPLRQAVMTLSNGAMTLSVILEGITGRVRTQ
jgi:Tfp pilus assembly protein FimT